MKIRLNARARLARLQSSIAARKRRLHVDPNEIAMVRVMGGRVIELPFWRDSVTQIPAVIVLSLGPIFKRERVSRGVMVGGRRLSFGNDIRRGIEFDGREYRGDILKQMEADEFFQAADWQVIHVMPGDMKADPRAVRRAILLHLIR